MPIIALPAVSTFTATYNELDVHQVSWSVSYTQG
jgi:hypothetical protein